MGLTNISTVFDVGANCGDFAQAAAACFPEAKVTLFEPLPSLWPRLHRLASNHAERWRVEKIALGKAPDRMPLHISEGDNSIGSFLGFSEEYREGNTTVTSAQTIDCQIDSLDAFCERAKIASIDLLKIDVEGFEFEVMEGAATMLSRTEALIVEVSLIRQAGGAADALAEMIALLTQKGFRIVDVVPSLHSPNEPWKPLEYNLLARRTARG